MNELLEKYKKYYKEANEYGYAIFIMSFDQVTGCPYKDMERSSEVQNVFRNKLLDISLSPDFIDTVYKLYEMRDELDEVTKLDVEIEYKNLEKMRKIPKEELEKFYVLASKSQDLWQEASRTLDYSKFKVELKELVKYYNKYIKWEETDKIKGFDVLLDDMEDGYTEEKYDKFFNLIEEELVPFIKDILKKPQPYPVVLDTLKFDIDKQKKLTEMIAERMEYTNEVGLIRETMHPFTNWANHNDVRITTSYSEDLLFSNLYSVMHEIGHALFQLHMDPKYDDTNIFGNVTCITHESQSRFYENYLGRRESFIKFLYPELIKLFPEELKGITEKDIYNYVNSCKAQFIRCEADELTYPIHILIRYKVEKALFSGEIDVDGMEGLFNKLFTEYLGITPRNEREGVFQDVHWSSGFGYFPTYSVGSAYGAQFLEAIMKDVDIDKDLSEGNFKNINEWLKEHIHKYSSTRKNDEVVRAVCNEEFDPRKYIKYLKDKFNKIYND